MCWKPAEIHAPLGLAITNSIPTEANQAREAELGKGVQGSAVPVAAPAHRTVCGTPLEVQLPAAKLKASNSQQKHQGSFHS